MGKTKIATIPAGTIVPAFRYAPGDGRVYTWEGGTDTITVHRIQYQGATRHEVPTGDTLPLPAHRTASALMETVDAWRATA